MRKQASRWPTGRHLFGRYGKRRGVAVWVVVALSVAATVLLVGFWRHPAL